MKKEVYKGVVVNEVDLDLNYLIEKLISLRPSGVYTPTIVTIEQQTGDYEGNTYFSVTHFVDMTTDEIANHYDKLAKDKLRERESKTIQYYKLKQELGL